MSGEKPTALQDALECAENSCSCVTHAPGLDWPRAAVLAAALRAAREELDRVTYIAETCCKPAMARAKSLEAALRECVNTAETYLRTPHSNNPTYGPDHSTVALRSALAAAKKVMEKP